RESAAQRDDVVAWRIGHACHRDVAGGSAAESGERLQVRLDQARRCPVGNRSGGLSEEGKLERRRRRSGGFKDELFVVVDLTQEARRGLGGIENAIAENLDGGGDGDLIGAEFDEL